MRLLVVVGGGGGGQYTLVHGAHSGAERARADQPSPEHTLLHSQLLPATPRSSSTAARTRDTRPRRRNAVVIQLVIGAVPHARRHLARRPLDRLLHQAALLALLGLRASGGGHEWGRVRWREEGEE